MRNAIFYLALYLCVGTGAAIAQSINLSGRYICVNCSPAQPAIGYITQNGRDLNIVNEAGQSSRGYEAIPAGFGHSTGTKAPWSHPTA